LDVQTKKKDKFEILINDFLKIAAVLKADVKHSILHVLIFILLYELFDLKELYKVVLIDSNNIDRLNVYISK